MTCKSKGKSKCESEHKISDIGQNEINYEEIIKSLELKNKELEEMCKRAQLDYINLKTDVDIKNRHLEEKEKNLYTEILISIIKDILPFTENLRKSIINIPEDQKDLPLSKGLDMTYNNFLKFLDKLQIKPIESIGLDPDSKLHEPINVQPTKEKNLKGKIIQEFEQGFVLNNNGEQIVIKTSKVIIGQ